MESLLSLHGEVEPTASSPPSETAPPAKKAAKKGNR